MMDSLNNLVTTYSFRGKDYVVNLNSNRKLSPCIELKVTNKRTLEEWQGSYDASYIENLTHKTGNYKRFETFVSMLKSALLRTSQCVTLDLLTFEDLEMLRVRKTQSKVFSAPNSSQILGAPSNNRRYLIITYTVEFDRIHYPLAMEYCGPPDPRILQETIERLEKQVFDLQNQLDGSGWDDITHQIGLLQKKVLEVTSENVCLKEQMKKLSTTKKNRNSCKETDLLLKSIHSLENRLVLECENVQLLKKENSRLTLQLEEVSRNEKHLRTQINALHFEPNLKSKDANFHKKLSSSLSPSRNRSSENLVEKPFRRNGNRKVSSARSYVNVAQSSSDDSFLGERTGKRQKHRQELLMKVSPRARASSPSFSDLSHHSGFSRCACRNCLHSKYLGTRREHLPGNIKSQNGVGKANMLKRIQSLENLIRGIVLN